MPSCPKCSASLPASAWAQHQRLYHDCPGLETGFFSDCPDCPFASRCFPATIAHALLEGHRLRPLEAGGGSIKARNAEISISRLPEPLKDEHEEECEEEKMDGASYPRAAKFRGAESVTSKWIERAPAVADSLEQVAKLDEQSSVPSETGSDLDAKKKKPLQRPLQPTVDCSRCRNAVTAHRGHLTDHARACCGIKPYSCSYCGYLATRMYYVGRHIKTRCPAASVLSVVDKVADSEAWGTCFPGISLSLKELEIGSG